MTFKAFEKQVPWSDWAIRLIGCGILAYGSAVAALYLRQRSMLFVPDKTKPQAKLVGLTGLHEVSFTTADGLRLMGWYRAPEPGYPTLLYFHGNGGNLGYRSARIRELGHTRWGLMFPEYRGYGGNQGSPTEAGLALDAEGARAFLAGEGVVWGRTVVYGESMGTGVATGLAAGTSPAALILEAPFTSMIDLARRIFPWVPVSLLARDAFKVASRIGMVRAPVLVMNGGRDRVVPPTMGREVFRLAAGPKEFWSAPRGEHENLSLFGAEGEAVRFVRRHVSGA